MNRRISIGVLLLLFLLLNYSTASAQQPVSGDKTFTMGGVSFTMKAAAAGSTPPGAAVYRSATAARQTPASTASSASALPCSRAHVLPHDRSLMKG